MRVTYLLPVLITISLTSHSQARFDIFAGPQTTTAKYIIRDIKQPDDNKVGFQAGFGLKVPFDNHLFFSPAVFYSLKGYKVKFNQFAYPPDTLATDNNTSIHSVELAFLLQIDIGDQPSHFFIKAGPSLDFQLGGKEKFHLKNSSLVDRSMRYDFTAYGHYSANLLMQLGFETKGGFLIFGQYSLGLGNLNNADGGPDIKHRILGLSVGTYLHKKKIK
ncbi:MAG: porin family protein [Chitinophagales bacterium]